MKLIFYAYTLTYRSTSSQEDLAVIEALNIDLKQQLQVSEQETNILRTKINGLEQENEKLLAEIKKNQLQTSKSFLKGSNFPSNNKENDNYNVVLEELKNENEKLKLRLKILESSSIILPERAPKICSDSNTKFQLKVCIDANLIFRVFIFFLILEND